MPFFCGTDVPKLLSQGGTLVDTANVLAGKKYVLLYFSAHWCPPCRRFTPLLVEFFGLLQSSPRRDDTLVVFVSGDRSKEQFDEYFAEMPWLAVPYDNRKASAVLNKKLKVEGIPTLVLLNAATGTVINSDAADIVREKGASKALESFPWIPRSIKDVLAGATITSKSGQPISITDLEKLDAFALYFSAHWCPPCRGFTPVLTETYHNMKSNGKHNFEIIFVSSDRAENDFDEYYSGMPWAALKYGDPAKAELSSLCGVEGIPTLATISPTFEIITTKARNVVPNDKYGDKFPWAPTPLPLVAALTMEESSVDAINEHVCFLLRNGEGKEAVTSAWKSAAESVNAKVTKSSDDDALKVTFFVVGDDGKELFGRIMSVAKPTDLPAEDDVPFVLALRLGPGKLTAVLSGDRVTDAAAIDSFATTFYKKASEADEEDHGNDGDDE